MNPLQLLYSLGLKLDRSFTKAEKLSYPVVSVGNISVGGRAKTPMVIELCQMLKRAGYVPVVLTRGYARKSKEDMWLLPEVIHDLQKLSADESGDEAVEIFLKAEVAVLVSAERATQAKKYAQQFKNSKTIFVLDDGFQHWKLKRDFDLVMLAPEDHADGLLPTGRLRETTEALKRANFVLELSKDIKKVIEIKAKEKISHSTAMALTTRAGNQSLYSKSLDSYFGFHVPHLSLRDHLHKEAMLKELKALPSNVNQLILGVKEAVKLLAPQDLLKHKHFPLQLTLEERKFEVFLVELHLEYDREKLWNSLREKLS